MKYTSPTALISTVTKLTKPDIGNKLSVKRKFEEGDSTHRVRWWFLLKADKAVLSELENLWETVQLQTNWKLETCTNLTTRVLLLLTDHARNLTQLKLKVNTT